jgi:hypothetical protein
MRLYDLLEQEFKSAETPSRLRNTLPPMVILPELVNSNGYPQYRHGLALATALAVENGEVEYDQQSMWNQSETVICYTPQERDILEKANKLMGVKGKPITSSRSCEPDWVNKKSPVVQNTLTRPE